MSALTPEEARSVKRTVEREVELAKGRYHSQPSPRAILLAGQPGAGKTILSSLLQSSLDDDAVFINGDDYRRYHPHYSEFYKQYGSDSVPMTSAFSGEVTENLIARFSDLAFNMVIEGTGRTVDVPKRTATFLAEKGYIVEMAVIATRPLLSLISTLLRFYQMNEHGTIPRATALEAHDSVVAVLPSNLDALSTFPRLSRITIWTRGAELVYDSEVDTPPPSKALERIWKAGWSHAEEAEAAAQIKELRTLEKKMALGQGRIIEEINTRFLRETNEHER